MGAPAKKLADSIGAKLEIRLPVEALTQMALVACAADFLTSEDIGGTSEGGREPLYA